MGCRPYLPERCKKGTVAGMTMARENDELRLCQPSALMELTWSWPESVATSPLVVQQVPKMAKGRKTHPLEYRHRLVEMCRVGRGADSLARGFDPRCMLTVSQLRLRKPF